MFGWLSTSIPCYPETINLKTNVHNSPIGVTPYIELEPTEHPLAMEKREGIPRNVLNRLQRNYVRQRKIDNFYLIH
jgi:hypothetical protein